MRERNAEAPDPQALDIFAGGGEMGERMRALDWASTALLHPETWPQSLRTVVGFILNAKQPMFVAWGPRLAFLYNEDYAPIFGNKHPDALGKAFAEVWSDIWEQIEPIVEQTMAGEASFYEDLLIPMSRHGFREDAWFTFSYTPLRDEAGRIAGMLCAAMETTGKVLAERRLFEERRRQQRLFEKAPGFIAILSGKDKVFEFVNEAYERLFGNRAFVGKTVREAFPELVGQGFHEILDKVYTDGERFVAEHVAISLQPAPGAEIKDHFLDFIYEPVLDEAGAVTGIFVEGYDVTGTYLAREALRESEVRFRNMADHAPVMMWITDARGYRTYLNRGWYEFTGQSKAEALGLGWAGATHPDDRTMAEETFLAANVAQTAFRLEYRLRRRDGEYRWAIDAASPRFSASGEYLGYVGSVIDIDERREAEDALRASEAHLNALFEQNAAGLCETDPAGRITRVNDRYCEITGRSRQELLELRRQDLTHLDDRKVTLILFDRMIADGEAFEIEERYVRPDGAVVWVENHVSGVRGGDGAVRSAVAVCVDVTDRKTGEDHLRLMVNELNHRVKNSLATVQAIAAQTFRNPDSFEQARDDFSSRLIALAKANDILTQSNWSGAALAEIVEQTLEPHQGAGRGRFRTEGPDVLLTPKAALSMSMAFHELCTNAAKYGALSSENGEVTVTWSVDATDAEPRLKVIWRESGGPKVEPPNRRGFGSRLIERNLAAELDGCVAIDYAPGGVVCFIDVPLPIT